MEDLTILLELLGKLCTREQIKSLLEEARGNKDVRLTAPNKDDLLQINLTAAIRANSIDLKRVYGLLSEAEENGDQHVFYWKLANAKARPAMEFSVVVKALQISQKGLHAFPKLDLIPDGFTLADVRSLSPQKTFDWVYKVYGDETREHFTGRIVRDLEDDRKYLKEFETRKLRHILLVRWNYPDLLELRVPRDTSRTRITTWLTYLWRELQPAIDQNWFKPWDLSRARANLIRSDQLDGVLFRLRDTQVEAPGHERATFEPHSPGGGLFSAHHMRTAVGNLLDAQSTCTRLNVSWLPTKGEDFEDDIRTQIGNIFDHEVIFSSKQRSREIDYVTDQLRKFSRART